MKRTEKTVKILRTSSLYFAFLGLGICVAIPGPTLLDLQQMVKTDTGSVSFIYLASSGAAMVGSFIGGILFDATTKKQLLLAGLNMVAAISALVTPWTRSLAALLGAWSVIGLSLGAMDTAANVVCLRIWEKDSRPYLQGLHFVYGIGTFIAPLIAEPFLSNCNPNETPLQHNESISNETVNNLTVHENTNSSCDSYSVPPITYAYTITGVIAIVSTLFLLVLAIKFPDHKKQKKTDSNDNDKASKKHSLGYTIIIAVTTQILLFLFCGIELGYGQMIATYAVKGDLKLPKTTASFMTAVYWGSFSVSRGVAIILTYKLSAFTMVFVDLLAVLLSTVILVIYGNTYVEALWTGTFLLGFGCASLFPSVMSWVECYVHINNRIASLFVIAVCLGGMIYPSVAGTFVESEPHMLMYICLGSAIGGCLMAFCLWFLLTKKGKKA